ncbi:MAG: type IV toxin-antitoxin system AbiEi family antitoxin domain-containing protein [Solirubrobacterales bacterium]
MAAEAEGVLDLGELGACGLDRKAVAWRAEHGRLHRMHQGIYAVGHPSVSLRGRFIAATKACGPDASLSHRSAAVRDGFMEWIERDVEVTIPPSVTRVRPGIQVHRSSLITRGDLMVRDNVFVTKPTWTVVALASVLSPVQLRRATRNALALKRTSLPGLAATLDRVGPQRGTRALREILAKGAVPTRSELEDVVYDLILAGGFAAPQVNAPLRLGGRIVIPDFRWPEQCLVVEADGAKWHDNALARLDDAERQALLERHGDTVLRIRWDEAVARPAAAWKRLEAVGAPR